ncbi:MAG: Na/Pi cotransporter family protein [Clostridia bacterium]|nr:Na/Pi cotransporter family protein [Clostridia bacterium]
MSIFSVFTLLGGLAFFLYGMNVMSSGLEKVAGGKLESTLRKMTGNRFSGLALGAGITIAIQSSSALTVMLVGLVNSGLMELGQTVGVIMGSNIGTTFTAWILSLAGIGSDNFFLNLLKPVNFSMIFALVGILLGSIAKSDRKKSLGNIMIGFAILMTGMTLMGDAMKPLADTPQFVSLLTAFKNPFVCVLIGAAFTGIIQSSAASVGILQALALTGGITYNMAIPIIMGQNIGTCVTAVISSIGVGRNAKRVSVIHLSFNIIGTLVCLVPYLLIDTFIGFTFAEMPISPFMIAIIHSIFNVATTLLLLPFAKQLVKLAYRIIKGEEEKGDDIKFDDRLITMPSLAIASAFDGTVDMCRTAGEAFKVSAGLLKNFNEADAQKVTDLEDRIDIYEDRIGTYMVKISRESISVGDSHQVAKILHTINDFERLGDHACNLIKVGREINDKKIIFSEEAQRELSILHDALFEIVDITTEAFCNNDLALAAKVEPLEQVIDKLISKTKKNHIERLRQGNCTIELGFVLGDLITNYERVSDHCSNIAVAIIEAEHDSFDTHEYLKNYKSSDEYFKACFEEYKEKYAL